LASSTAAASHTFTDRSLSPSPFLLKKERKKQQVFLCSSNNKKVNVVVPLTVSAKPGAHGDQHRDETCGSTIAKFDSESDCHNRLCVSVCLCVSF